MSQKVGWLAVLTFMVSCSVHATANVGKEAGDRGFDIPHLKTLDAPVLTPEKKAHLGLSLLRQELDHPTPPLRPPFTNFKTHDYFLARITRKLVECGADLDTLRKTRAKEDPGELRDCLTLALLWASPGHGQKT